MNQYKFTPPYKNAMASPRMGPRDWVRSKETKLNSSAQKNMLAVGIKERYVKKAALVVLTKRAK